MARVTENATWDMRRADDRIAVIHHALLLDALTVAVEAGRGEVILRSGMQIARISIVDGKVAWVDTSTPGPSFVAHLVEHLRIERFALVHVLERCRRECRSFTELLVEDGIVQRNQLVDELRKYLGDRLKDILRWPHLEASFVPCPWQSESRALVPVPDLVHTATDDDVDEEAPTQRQMMPLRVTGYEPLTVGRRRPPRRPRTSTVAHA